MGRFPALAFFATTLKINVMGNALRDWLDLHNNRQRRLRGEARRRKRWLKSRSPSDRRGFPVGVDPVCPGLRVRGRRGP